MFSPGFFHFCSMKFRRLHRQELESVRDDFVKFLAANSIEASEWEKLKAESPKKAEGLIDIFSDIFWEKSLANVKCLEIRKSHSLRVMHFEEKSIELIELRLPATSAVDLTHKEDIESIAAGTIDLADQEPELYTGSRNYEYERERELFNFLEQGARPCSDKLYYGLKAMINKT